MTTTNFDAPVLIAGGGLVGLSAAMFLAQHGIRSLAIERRRNVLQLPRAAFFHMRTIERSVTLRKRKPATQLRMSARRSLSSYYAAASAFLIIQSRSTGLRAGVLSPTSRDTTSSAASSSPVTLLM